ncbi:patched family protein [Dictyocaulus viviparus]|uniref:Patched family protein n=1 Tax=Dictyocaulus viviparus TaxID=29172 RepID=A0A0D8Y2R9_DICVI|nr:patched family protein [Dictyocaulus viviparus]
MIKRFFFCSDNKGSSIRIFANKRAMEIRICGEYIDKILLRNYILVPNVLNGVLSEHWPLDEQRFWPGKSYDLHGYVDIIGRQFFGSLFLPLYCFLLCILRFFLVAYTDLCMSFDWACYLNDHLTMLMPKHRWGDFSGPIAEFASDIINSEVNITYPIGWRGSEPIYFGALVGNPHLVDNEGHFDYATALRLTYNVREEKVGNISFIWRKKLASWLTDRNNPPSDMLEFGLTHNESLPEGLQDVADTLTPKFVGTCAILFTFCFLVSVVLINHGNGLIGIDWVRSKPIVACAGIWCPLLAVITSFGLLLWLGELYNAIVNVSPFLILCIGIDDLFIMSAEWHRTNPDHSPARRVADTLSEAAVAITITSVTDIVSDVWYWDFYYAAWCTNVLPVHELTSYVHLHLPASKWKLFLLSGSVSRKSQLSLKPLTKEMPPEGQHKTTGWRLKLNRALKKLETKLEQNEKQMDQIKREETFVNKLFREIVGPFILERSTRICAVLLYCIYLILSIYGCLNIKEGLDPKFLVRESFYLSTFYKLIDESFWQEGLQMQVVVNQPPDLFNSSTREEFSKMLNDFENTYYTMSHNATMIWLQAYESHLEKEMNEFNIAKPTSSSEWYHRCRDWLLVAGGRRLWEKDMVWGQSAEDFYELKAFRFQLGLRNYRTPTDHTNSCKLMREIASKYANFNVTTFHEYYPFADQYLELKPSLVQNFTLGLLSMLLVTMIMIPDIRAAFAVVLCIASINVGVLGFMTFWGVNLDSVSMITVIMCIGFAVDLSAHIAYAYSQAYGDAEKRVVHAMETLGWPVFLGASSTILGIMVLTLVDSYIVLIFFKTVFLVISFSMIHGLLFLPVLLMFIIPEGREKISEENSKQRKRKVIFTCDSSPDLRRSIDFKDIKLFEVENDSKMGKKHEVPGVVKWSTAKSTTTENSSSTSVI